MERFSRSRSSHSPIDGLSNNQLGDNHRRSEEVNRLPSSRRASQTDFLRPPASSHEQAADTRTRSSSRIRTDFLRHSLSASHEPEASPNAPHITETPRHGLDFLRPASSSQALDVPNAPHITKPRSIFRSRSSEILRSDRSSTFQQSGEEVISGSQHDQPSIPLEHLNPRPSSMDISSMYDRQTVHPSEVRIGAPIDQSNLSNKDLQIYTQRVIKDLKIPSELHEDFRVPITIMYRMLEKSKDATSMDAYKEASKAVLSFVPDNKLRLFRGIREGNFGKVSGIILFGGKETRLETENIRTRGDLRIAREAVDKNRFSRGFDKTSHALEWRLNKPGYRFALASGFGVASILTPLAYGGKLELIAIPVNVGATYADTAIFQKTGYPWNLLITTGVWQGSSFATAYLQKGIDKLEEKNSNATQLKFMTHEFANLLAEPFGNTTLGNSTLGSLLMGRLDGFTKQGSIIIEVTRSV